MSELRTLLADTAAKVLANEGAWRDAGLDKVLVPEDGGGFGGGWEDALIVLRTAGSVGGVDPLAKAIIAADPHKADDSAQLMALATTCQMAGAMGAALELT
ncbi:MAG: hypothetical protein JO346_02365, partial [Alphaproteobacteria bacterium]|nr:hypothetical protein [Alphaproteobacteria bacterium]